MPVWLFLVVSFAVLIVLGRKRGTRRGPATGRTGTAVLVLGAGFVLMMAGAVLETELCLPDYGDCEGIEPAWSPGGAVLMNVGFGICLIGPALPLLWRRREPAP